MTTTVIWNEKWEMNSIIHYNAIHNGFFDFYRVGNADVNDNLYIQYIPACVMSLGRVFIIFLKFFFSSKSKMISTKNIYKKNNRLCQTSSILFV